MHRLHAIMLVRNEQSIIADSVGHLLKHVGIERVHVVDNGSTDDTPTILARLAAVDPRVVWRSEPGGFAQPDILSALAAEARQAGADWIIPTDADEFLDWGAGGLRALETATDTGAFEIGLCNFVPFRWAITEAPGSIERMWFSAVPYGDPVAARELVEGGTIPFLRMAYPPKLLYRAAAGLRLERGNHGAEGIAGPTRKLPGAEILHAPIRARDDLPPRLDHARRLMTMEPNPNIGWHFRRLAMLGEAGGLTREWRSNSTFGGWLPGAERQRSLRLDLRLRRIGRQLFGFRRRVALL
jgi:hypothetical protein